MSHLSILEIEFLLTPFPNNCCSALRSSSVSAVDRLQTVQCYSESQSCGRKWDYNCNLVVIMSASPCCIRQFAALTTGCACTQAMTRTYCSCTRRATSHSINAASRFRRNGHKPGVTRHTCTPYCHCCISALAGSFHDLFGSVSSA